MFIGPGLFAATDADRNGELTRAELKDTFGKWFAEWERRKGRLVESRETSQRLKPALLVQISVAPVVGRGAGGGRAGGGPGFGGGLKVEALNSSSRCSQDSNKPLLSKLLAVPSLRTRNT